MKYRPVVELVEILDSTLREGEQTPGVTFKVEEKLEIAYLLDGLGVDIIEAGHPCVSNDVKVGLKTIAKAGLDASVLAHSRALISDIDMVIESDADWIGIFISVLEDRLKLDFRKDLDQVITMVVNAVEYAKDHGLKVRYTPEDTIRSDPVSVFSVASAALGAGADRISIADTVGAATPGKMKDFTSELIENTGAVVNVHCHNDLGLALANSLAAFEGGAVLIDACVNGLGERAGITDLSTLLMSMNVLYGIENKWDLTLLPVLSDLVERRSGMKVSSNAPIIGTNAYSHNAGLHVSAAFIQPSFYEVVPAEIIGRARTFEVDKMVSEDLVRKILSESGSDPGDEAVQSAVRVIKSREKGSFSPEDVRSMVKYRIK